MTKVDLVERVYRRHGGISRRESAEIVERLLARIKADLRHHRKVQIPGFGAFEVVSRRPRRGRNPKTGEEIVIDGKCALVFRPSRVLLGRLN